MNRMLALSGLTFSLFADSAFAQQPAASTTQPAASATTQPTLIRDPRTGELYQQELQTVDQPVTNWQRRVVDRTVVTPTTVIENEQVPQTVFVPKTEYVLQTKLKGWWNPFTQPTYAYEYVPVTSWVPQTQMVTRQVPKTKMISRTEQIAIDEPVQTTQKVTQIVLRRLPNQAGNNLAVASAAPAAVVSPRAYAYQTYPNATSATAAYNAYVPPMTVPTTRSQPLIASVPVLGQPRPQTWQPGTLLQAPVNGLRNIVRTAAAPFNGQATYSAPMNVATLPPSYGTRDLNQTGMPATVLR